MTEPTLQQQLHFEKIVVPINGVEHWTVCISQETDGWYVYSPETVQEGFGPTAEAAYDDWWLRAWAPKSTRPPNPLPRKPRVIKFPLRGRWLERAIVGLPPSWTEREASMIAGGG